MDGTEAGFARDNMGGAQKGLGARRLTMKWCKNNGVSSAQSLSLCQTQVIAIVALAFVDVEPFLVCMGCSMLFFACCSRGRGRLQYRALLVQSVLPDY